MLRTGYFPLNGVKKGLKMIIYWIAPGRGSNWYESDSDVLRMWVGIFAQTSLNTRFLFFKCREQGIFFDFLKKMSQEFVFFSNVCENCSLTWSFYQKLVLFFQISFRTGWVYQNQQRTLKSIILLSTIPPPGLHEFVVSNCIWKYHIAYDRRR